MAEKVRSPKEIIGEFIHHLEGFVPGVVVTEKKPAYNGNHILVIRAKGYPKASTHLQYLVDTSITGSLYQEAALLAKAMTGKTLEELGASDVFDNAMIRVEKVWTRGKEAGHLDSMQPSGLKELPPEFQGDVAIREGETTRSERIDGTSDLTSPLGLGRDNATGNTEGNAQTGEEKPKRKRGRPRKSDKGR